MIYAKSIQIVYGSMNCSIRGNETRPCFGPGGFSLMTFTILFASIITSYAIKMTLLLFRIRHPLFNNLTLFLLQIGVFPSSSNALGTLYFLLFSFFSPDIGINEVIKLPCILKFFKLLSSCGSLIRGPLVSIDPGAFVDKIDNRETHFSRLVDQLVFELVSFSIFHSIFEDVRSDNLPIQLRFSDIVAWTMSTLSIFTNAFKMAHITISMAFANVENCPILFESVDICA